jgi:chitodextrinase
VWVAGGVYDTLTAVITLKDKVSLYGGFAGTEVSIEERAKVANGQPWDFQHPTVLISKVGVFVKPSGHTTANATIIDGFTTEGFVNAAAALGGYAINYNATGDGGITVRSCIIQNSCLGYTGTADHGGIVVKGSQCVVEYCLIQNNKGKNGGGAQVEAATLRSCVVRNNKTRLDGASSAGNAANAGNGGGVFILGTGKVYSCWIEGNEASYGGGAFMGNNANAVFYNSVVVNNTASKNGGAISYDTRGASCFAYNVTLANNTATATDGGGVFMPATGNRLYNSIIYNNKDANGTVKNIDVASDKVPVLKNNISDADLSTYGTGNLIATDSAALFGEKWITAATSSGKDKGTVDGITPPEKDFAGRMRVKGASIDIGPYEYPEPPVAPTELVLIPSTENIIVRWTASTAVGMAGYNVYCGGVKQNTELLTVMEYTITGLTKGTAYAVAVEAVDIDGIVSSPRLSGSTTTLATADATPPTEPAKLTAVAVTKTTIVVSYGRSSDEVGVLGYKIYADGKEKGTTTDLSYTITGLAPGTTYKVEVKAYDAAGNHSTSQAPLVTTLEANQLTIFYVKPNDASTLWAAKNQYFVKTKVQDAMDAAKILPEICELWVGAGEYLNVSLALADSISLYGGFAGTESAISERAKGSEPWSYANATVLRGETPAYNSTNSNNINSLSVIKQNFKAAYPIVVDGFTLTNGEHGLLLLGEGNTTVKNCIIKGNGQLPSGTSGIDGGGVEIRGTAGKFRVSYCLIEDNKGKSGGGVMIAEASDKAVVEYCTIRNNKALTINTDTWYFGSDDKTIHGWGGGVFNQSGVVNSCLISGNEALAGGGILVRTNTSRFNSCIVVNNSAVFGGGLTYDKRGANASANKNVYNCLFANNGVAQKPDYVKKGTTPANEKGSGGGVFFTGDGQEIYNSIFLGNVDADTTLSAVGDGGTRGKLVSSFVDVEADTVGGNAYHPASDDFYEAGTWKPKDSFTGVDAGAEGNTSARDYEGKVRVKGSAIDVGPYEKPGVPNPPTAIVLTPDINDVEVSWTPSPDIDVVKYAVYVNEGTTGDATTLITDTITRATFTVKGLKEYTDYVISVKGIDEIGQRTVPLTGYVTTLSPYTPSRPSLIDTLTIPDDNKVKLTWKSSGANATHYILFKNGDSVNQVLAPAVATDSVAAEVAGLQPYTLYTFAVQAVNRSGAPVYKSRISLPLTLRTTDKVAPHVAPSALVHTDSTLTSITVTWTAAADNVGIAFYYIYWDGALVDSTRSNATVYARGGLPARLDTTYSVYVVGVDSAGNTSGSSPAITVKTGSKADLPVWYVGTWASKPSNRVFKTISDAQNDISEVTGDTAHSEIWIQAGEYDITTTISLSNRATSYYGGFAGSESSVGERAKPAGAKGWEFVNVTKLIRAADVHVMEGKYDANKVYSISGDITIDGISFDGKNEGVNKRAIYVSNVYLRDTAKGVNEEYKVYVKRCIVEGFGQEGTGAVGGGTDGAIAIRDCNGHGYIDSCLVQNNKGNVGVGIYVAEADNCNIRVVSNCYILNNSTGNVSNSPANTSGAPTNWGGGAIANKATIRSCYIAGNTAYGGGGVVFRSPGSKLENCIIVNNTASFGGGMLFHQAVNEGLTTNNTIAENQAAIAGGGIYATADAQQILNNILWKNTNTTQNVVENVGVMSQKSPKLFNNIVSENDSYKGSEPVVMPVSAPKDAIFDGPSAGYEGWHTKLSDSSIVYDRGTLEVIGYEMPTTDYTGAARIAGGRIDIGPFEYQGDPDAPSTPDSVTVTGKNETSITIAWGASSMPEAATATLNGYHVYVNREQRATVAAPATTYTITGLSPWTEYTIQVDAYSSAGKTSPKTTELFKAKTTDVTPPEAPVNLTVKTGKDNTNGTYIRVQWNLSSDNVAVTGYYIYLNGEQTGAVGSTGTSYTFSYLTASTEYTVEVSALDDAGNESARASATATTPAEGEDTPSAIWSVQTATLQVFPNPVVNGELVIVNGELKAGERIAIYTVDGVAALTGEVSGGAQTLVNVSSLKSGIYVVRAGKLAVKIIVVNQ